MGFNCLQGQVNLLDSLKFCRVLEGCIRCMERCLCWAPYLQQHATSHPCSECICKEAMLLIIAAETVIIFFLKSSDKRRWSLLRVAAITKALGDLHVLIQGSKSCNSNFSRNLEATEGAFLGLFTTYLPLLVTLTSCIIMSRRYHHSLVQGFWWLRSKF